MKKISPSIFNADFGHLKDEIKVVEEGKVEYLHLDIMDGNFVPTITFGANVVQMANDITDLPLDVHLMVNNPEHHIENFVRAGADVITVHAEACTHLYRVLQQIKSYDIKVGVALNPATPLNYLDHVMDELDMVLLMTVNPGFGGTTFIPSIVQKIADLKEKIQKSNKNIEIEVDGGINAETARLCSQAGADIFVVGSYIYNSENRLATIKKLRDIIE